MLSVDRIRVPLESPSKSALFRELVHLAMPEADSVTADSIVASVEQRETQLSTAMGDGLAVPHGRTPLVGEVRLAAARIEPIAGFDGPDGHPVRIVFLVLTPQDSKREHLRVLAGIARVMRQHDLRDALLESGDATSFLDVIRQADGAVQTT